MHSGIDFIRLRRILKSSIIVFIVMTDISSEIPTSIEIEFTVVYIKGVV